MSQLGAVFRMRLEIYLRDPLECLARQHGRLYGQRVPERRPIRASRDEAVSPIHDQATGASDGRRRLSRWTS